MILSSYGIMSGAMTVGDLVIILIVLWLKKYNIYQLCYSYFDNKLFRDATIEKCEQWSTFFWTEKRTLVGKGQEHPPTLQCNHHHHYLSISFSLFSLSLSCFLSSVTKIRKAR